MRYAACNRARSRTRTCARPGHRRTVCSAGSRPKGGGLRQRTGEFTTDPPFSTSTHTGAKGTRLLCLPGVCSADPLRSWPPRPWWACRAPVPPPVRASERRHSAAASVKSERRASAREVAHMSACIHGQRPRAVRRQSEPRPCASPADSPRPASRPASFVPMGAA